MKIKKLIKAAGIKGCSCLGDFKATGLSCNSKNVKYGHLFVAVKGTKQDGAKFIDEAVRNGARVVLSERLASGNRCSDRVCFIKVKDARKALGKLAAEFYGNPSLKIKVVGITGTNGKTTIAYLLEALIKEAGLSSGVIGTINYRFGSKVIPSGNTTPGPVELQSILNRIFASGSRYAVMEVSSHALDQERVRGVRFHSAIFTNLTQDHLDYHKTIKDYFSAKVKLFKALSKSSFAVINNDDPYGRKIKRMTKARVVTYGIENKSDVSAKDIKFSSSGTEFTLNISGREELVKSRLIGRHNVYNLLASIAWARSAGIKFPCIKSVVERFSSVPGRLQRIDTAKGFHVFVDYAHTEDALKNILLALRELARNRIIVVFGCGGDRDKTKRPKMGRVVSNLADYTIITSDNPRSEDPITIIREIKAGIVRNNFCVIPDRKQAIKRALSIASCGDIVVVAGKGHENYQVLKNRTVHFNDCQTVRECLKSTN